MDADEAPYNCLQLEHVYGYLAPISSAYLLLLRGSNSALVSGTADMTAVTTWSITKRGCWSIWSALLAWYGSMATYGYLWLPMALYGPTYGSLPGSISTYLWLYTYLPTFGC
eukprot:3081373-Rhodomonas_salina.1